MHVINRILIDLFQLDGYIRRVFAWGMRNSISLKKKAAKILRPLWNVNLRNQYENKFELNGHNLLIKISPSLT